MNLSTVLNAVGHAAMTLPAGTVDLALVGALTYFVVQLAAKPLLAKRIDPTGSGFDAAVPAASAFVAFLLITLASYAPGAFEILSASVLVATGGVGINRISKNEVSGPSPTIPLGTFTSLTPIHGEEPIPASEPLTPAVETPAVPTA